MATKYGYVERNLENDVNWGSVGKGFSDMLLAERDERKAKKEFLNDKMVQTQDALKKSPLGYDTNYNDKMISLSSNGSSFLYALEKDLKQGRISPEDYLRTIQRMNGSLDEIFNLSNNYNALYEEHLNRVDSEGASYMETKLFEDIDNMTKFNEYDFFLDSSGIIGAAPLVKGADGLTTIDPTKARSAQAIYNLAQNFINKIPLEEETKAASDRLAKFVRETSTAASYKNPGMTKSYDDIRQMPEYSTLKEALIDGILSTDNKTASVLVDHIRGYEPETNLEKIPAADREKYVYLNTLNGKEATAELTKDQTKIARDRVGLLLEGMISSEYGEQATSKKDYPSSSGSGSSGGDKVESLRSAIQTMNKYFVGGASDYNIANSDVYTKFKALGENPQGLTRDPNTGVVISLPDGGNFTMPFYVNGSRLTQTEWLESSVRRVYPNASSKDISKYVAEFVSNNPGQFNEVDSYSDKYQENESLPQKIANESYQQLTGALSNEPNWKDNGVLYEKISPILSDYGLEMSTWFLGGNGIDIRDKDKTGKQQLVYSINLDDFNGSLDDLIKEIVNPVINKKRKLSDIITPETTGAKLIYPEWKKQNPSGSAAQYSQYFNSK